MASCKSIVSYISFALHSIAAIRINMVYARMCLVSKTDFNQSPEPTKVSKLQYSPFRRNCTANVSRVSKDERKNARVCSIQMLIKVNVGLHGMQTRKKTRQVNLGKLVWQTIEKQHTTKNGVDDPQQYGWQ